jgi:hypothetical protein
MSGPADALEQIDIPSRLERYFSGLRDSSYDQLTFLQYSVDTHPMFNESIVSVLEIVLSFG